MKKLILILLLAVTPSVMSVELLIHGTQGIFEDLDTTGMSQADIADFRWNADKGAIIEVTEDRNRGWGEVPPVYIRIRITNMSIAQVEKYTDRLENGNIELKERAYFMASDLVDSLIDVAINNPADTNEAKGLFTFRKNEIGGFFKRYVYDLAGDSVAVVDE